MARGQRVWQLNGVDGRTYEEIYSIILPSGKANKKNRSTIASRWEKYFLEHCPTELAERLVAMNLHVDRYLLELSRRLCATRALTYQGSVMMGANGEPVELEDNATRMRATELLAELNGVRRRTVEHSGSISLFGSIDVTDREREQVAAEILQFHQGANGDD